jgi:hypothetical protein
MKTETARKLKTKSTAWLKETAAGFSHVIAQLGADEAPADLQDDIDVLFPAIRRELERRGVAV